MRIVSIPLAPVPREQLTVLAIVDAIDDRDLSTLRSDLVAPAVADVVGLLARCSELSALIDGNLQGTTAGSGMDFGAIAGELRALQNRVAHHLADLLAIGAGIGARHVLQEIA